MSVIHLDKVGVTIKTTGKTWSGPSGGEWVEIDEETEGSAACGSRMTRCFSVLEAENIEFMDRRLDDAAIAEKWETLSVFSTATLN